jgi:hypothetical protein
MHVQTFCDSFGYILLRKHGHLAMALCSMRDFSARAVGVTRLSGGMDSLKRRQQASSSVV